LALAAASKGVAIRGQENALAHRLREWIAQNAKRTDSGKAKKNPKSPPSAARKHGRLRQSQAQPATLGNFRQAEHNAGSSPVKAGAMAITEHGIG
jgi:hypothetical protein